MDKYILAICDTPEIAVRIAHYLGLKKQNDIFSGSVKEEKIILTATFGPLVTRKTPSEMFKFFNWDDPRTHEKIENCCEYRVISHKDDKIKKIFEDKINQLRLLLEKAEYVLNLCRPNQPAIMSSLELLSYIGWDGDIKQVWLEGLGKESLESAFNQTKPIVFYKKIIDEAKISAESQYYHNILSGTYTYYARKVFGEKLLSPKNKSNIVKLGRYTPIILKAVIDESRERQKRNSITELKIKIRYNDSTYEGTYIQDHKNGNQQSLSNIEKKIKKASITLKDYREVLTDNEIKPATISNIFKRFHEIEPESIVNSLELLYVNGCISYPSNESELNKYRDRDQTKKFFESLMEGFSQQESMTARLSINDAEFEFDSIYDLKSKLYHAVQPLAIPDVNQFDKGDSTILIYNYIKELYIKSHSCQRKSKLYEAIFHDINNEDIKFKFKFESLNEITALDNPNGVTIQESTINKGNESVLGFHNLISVLEDYHHELNIPCIELSTVTHLKEELKYLHNNGYITNDDKCSKINITNEGLQLYNVIPSGMKYIKTENKKLKTNLLFEKYKEYVIKLNDLLFEKSRGEPIIYDQPLSEKTRTNIIKRAKSLGIKMPEISNERKGTIWLERNEMCISNPMKAMLKLIENTTNEQIPLFVDNEWVEALEFISDKITEIYNPLPSNELIQFAHSLEDLSGKTIPYTFQNDPLLLNRYITETLKYLVEDVTDQTKNTLQKYLIKYPRTFELDLIKKEFHADKLMKSLKDGIKM